MLLDSFRDDSLPSGTHSILFLSIFMVVLLVAAGVFLFTVIKSLLAWTSHPYPEPGIHHCSCKLVGKRVQVATPNEPRIGTTYYATFQFIDGSRQEFWIDKSLFLRLREGDQGTLLFKGSFCKQFLIRRTFIA